MKLRRLSDESYGAVLSCGIVYYAVQGVLSIEQYIPIVTFIVLYSMDQIQTLKSPNDFAQKNKQDHKKEVLNSFHFNGHNLGILCTDLKVKTTLYRIINGTSSTAKYCSIAFI